MISRVAELAGALVIVLVGFTAVCALTNDPNNRSESERGPVKHSGIGVVGPALEDAYTAKVALAQFPLPPSRRESEPGRTGLVVAMQTELAARGFATGPIDGIIHPETREAIRDYEAEFGLDVTGEPTRHLLEHIRMTRSLGQALQSPDLADRRELVSRVQKRLQELGYAVSAFSGVVDAPTRDAIAAFERDSGLAVTGDLTPQLVQRLGSGQAITQF